MRAVQTLSGAVLGLLVACSQVHAAEAALLVNGSGPKLELSLVADPYESAWISAEVEDAEGRPTGKGFASSPVLEVMAPIVLPLADGQVVRIRSARPLEATLSAAFRVSVPGSMRDFLFRFEFQPGQEGGQATLALAREFEAGALPFQVVESEPHKLVLARQEGAQEPEPPAPVDRDCCVIL
jgi:hypothetical protein